MLEFTADPGSSLIYTVEAPFFAGVSANAIQTEIGSAWSDPYIVQPGAVSVLTVPADGVVFEPLDAYGNPVAVSGNIAIGLGFASGGQGGVTFAEQASITPATVGVYRFFDTSDGTHFFTADFPSGISFWRRAPISRSKAWVSTRFRSPRPIRMPRQCIGFQHDSRLRAGNRKDDSPPDLHIAKHWTGCHDRHCGAHCKSTGQRLGRMIVTARLWSRQGLLHHAGRHDGSPHMSRGQRRHHRRQQKGEPSQTTPKPAVRQRGHELE